MQIGILGSGNVGRTLAAKLNGLGQQVMIGTRDVNALMTRGGDDPFADWLKGNDGVRVGTYSETAQFGEVLINATSGDGSIPALKAGEAHLAGKTLIDIANPLDFSGGFPPSLSVSNTDSLAEQIQRAFPDLKVVKTLNTLSAALMVDPGALADGEHDIFISGNDEQAKADVTGYLRSWFGWKHIHDLGDITTARGTEQLLALWVRLYAKLGTGMFNFRIVR